MHSNNFVSLNQTVFSMIQVILYNEEIKKSGREIRVREERKREKREAWPRVSVQICNAALPANSSWFTKPTEVFYSTHYNTI